MVKSQELINGASCLNKALLQEMVFVLRAKDPIAPAAIRFWVSERIRTKKNVPADDQIQEALACALTMEEQRKELFGL